MKQTTTRKPAWRKAVKNAMRTAAKQESTLRGNHTIPFLYRWEHVRAVVTTSIKLAELTGADVEIVEAAAWLHDIAKIKGEKHPSQGAKVAKSLLAGTNFPPEKIKQVAKCISDHKGLWRDTPLTNLESMVLWDADKLTKIGLLGTTHISTMLLLDGKIENSRELLARIQSMGWAEKTVASMHTAPAQQAAKTRLKRAKKFCENLEMELNGVDLL
jgi:uncharacterized protein